MAVPSISMAEHCPPGQGAQEDDPNCVLLNPAAGQLVSTSDFGELASDVIRVLLQVAGAIAVVFLIIGGFQYITSGGNEEGMEKAKGTIKGAVLGIIVIVLSFSIVVIINNVLTKGPGGL